MDTEGASLSLATCCLADAQETRASREFPSQNRDPASCSACAHQPSLRPADCGRADGDLSVETSKSSMRSRWLESARSGVRKSPNPRAKRARSARFVSIHEGAGRACDRGAHLRARRALRRLRVEIDLGAARCSGAARDDVLDEARRWGAGLRRARQSCARRKRAALTALCSRPSQGSSEHRTVSESSARAARSREMPSTCRA
jgi:hypothetical protein